MRAESFHFTWRTGHNSAPAIENDKEPTMKQSFSFPSQPPSHQL